MEHPFARKGRQTVAAALAWPRVAAATLRGKGRRGDGGTDVAEGSGGGGSGSGDGSSGPLARILTHIGWIFGGKGYGAVLSIFYLAFLTRTLGPTQYGAFALILSATVTLQALLNFNVWQVLVKYGQEHLHAGDGSALARLVRLCTAIDLASAAAGIAAAAAILHVGRDRLGLPADLAGPAFGYVVLFMLSIRNVPRGVLRLHSEFRLAFLAEAVVPTVKTLVPVVAVMTRPSIETFLWTWAGAEMASTLVFWWMAGSLTRRVHGRASAPRWWRAWHENEGLPSLLLAGNLGTMANTVLQQVPVLLIGSFASTQEAGIYRLAHQLAQSVTVLAGFIGLASYTEMAGVYAREKLGGVGTLFVRMTLLTIGLLLILMPTIALLGRPMLLLIAGPTFEGAYSFLLVLGLAACLQLAAVNCEPLLLAVGRARLIVAIRLAGVTTLVAAVAVLIPAFGAPGAAWAKVVAETVCLLLLFGAGLLILRRAPAS